VTYTPTTTSTTSITAKRKRFVKIPESVALYYQATQYDNNGNPMPEAKGCANVPESTAQYYEARLCELGH